MALDHPIAALEFLMEKKGILEMNDADFAKVIYDFKFGRKLDLNNPKTFNEKIQWLKLNDRKEVYTDYVDKSEAKKIASSIMGEEYIIPTYGVWNRYEEIDFGTLPCKFVLKCTHDSGSVLFVADKQKFIDSGEGSTLDGALEKNYYLRGHEWAYKNIKPRIIAEEHIESPDGDLRDYKVFCFNGVPKMIQVDFGRFTDHKRNLYTTDWKYLNASLHYPTDPSAQIERPAKLDELLMLASKLSGASEAAFMRTDFYMTGDRILFGEMTLYPGNGQEVFTPFSLDVKLGEFLKLDC